ncbi:ISAs1 family transposase, partial [Muribaculum intestinale]
ESIFSRTTPISVYTTEEKGHGRVEKRTCSIMDTTLLEQEGMYEKWPGLKRIIKMERERTENGARSRETIYYLSSVEKDEASYYAMRIRAHWGIENKLHWHLDVTFREDMCRVRAKNGAVNFSAMRKYALEMLKKQNDKLSLKRRRKKCMWSTEYLYKVFKDS